MSSSQQEPKADSYLSVKLPLHVVPDVISSLASSPFTIDLSQQLEEALRLVEEATYTIEKRSFGVLDNTFKRPVGSNAEMSQKLVELCSTKLSYEEYNLLLKED